MPINIIRQLVNKSNENKLNEKVLLSRDYSTIKDFFVSDKNASIDDYLEDIKIKNIIALGRDDGWHNTKEDSAYKENPTWKELLNNWIHGSDWTVCSIPYFENNEIAYKDFHTLKQSSNTLKMINNGGLYECVNGNHRLVGAVCWMVSKFGKDAVLKQVITYKFDIKDNLKEFLKELKENDVVKIGGSKKMFFDIKGLFDNPYDYIQVINKQYNKIKYYNVEENKKPIFIAEISYKRSVFDILKDYFKKLKGEYKDISFLNEISWTTVPNKFINVWKQQ